MSEVIGRLSQRLRQSIEKPPFGPVVEDQLLLKRRQAHQRLKERIRLIDDVEDALRQVRLTREHGQAPVAPRLTTF
jgi:hypothetical protein